jgi:opacity protein-like surface antigen
MKKVALAAVLGALAVAPVAQADIVDFAAVSAGITMSPDLDYNGTAFEMDNGANVGGEIGWELDSVADGNFSVGLDLFFTSQDYTGYLSSLESFSVMINGTYICDDLFTSVRPYIGVGAGLISVSYDGDSQFPAFTGTEMVFGYQGQLGLLIPIDPNLDLSIGYRYQAGTDAEIQGIEVEYQSHSAAIGIRVGL